MNTPHDDDAIAPPSVGGAIAEGELVMVERLDAIVRASEEETPEVQSARARLKNKGVTLLPRVARALRTEKARADALWDDADATVYQQGVIDGRKEAASEYARGRREAIEDRDLIRALGFALRVSEHAVKEAVSNASKMVSEGADVETPDGKRRLLRGPDGALENCAMAHGEPAGMCQMCGGKCPDRDAHGRGAAVGL